MQSIDKPIPNFDPAILRSLFAQTRPDAAGCWEWVGYRDADGYGAAKVDRTPYRAHRIFFHHLVHALAPGLVIDHLCRNRACVNPAHLEQVTVADNTHRGDAPSARNRMKTHCARGHEYTEANTYLDKTNRRHCRECSRERDRRAYVKRQRTHCKYGHEWTAETTLWVNNGKARRCAPCLAEYEAARNARRRRGVMEARALRIAIDDAEEARSA